MDSMNKDQKIELLMQQNKKLQMELLAYHQKVIGLSEKANLAEQQRDAVLNSTFWRLTGPLRKLSDYAKDIKNRKREPRVEQVEEIKEAAPVSVGKVSGFKALIEHSELYDSISSEDVLSEYDVTDHVKVLLVTHELKLTGAPVALLDFARVLKDNGYCPVILSPQEGILADNCKALQIPVLVNRTIYQTDVVLGFADLFDMVIACTIASSPIINLLAGRNLPVLWWIHEAQASYEFSDYSAPMPQHLPDNITVYVGGEYAYHMLMKYKPLYSADILLYYVPENPAAQNSNFKLPQNAENKKVFAIVGMQEYRKGQDILADAIMELSDDALRQSYFVFVGGQCSPVIYQKIVSICKYAPDNTLYIEQLSREDLHCLYEQIDCLICASRDDPMPIVASEALQHGRLVICSENAGTSSIIQKEQCGLIYFNNDAVELAEKINLVISGQLKADEFSSRARAAYEKYFSKETFEREAITAVEGILSRKLAKQRKLAAKSLQFHAVIEHLSQDERSPFVLYGKELLESYDSSNRKKILLVTHELSLTGAPLVLRNLARTLNGLETDVVFLSPADGPLGKQVEKDNIPVIVYPRLYENYFINECAECFNLVVLSTVVTFRLVNKLQFSNVPVVWWVHDSAKSYQEGGFSNLMIRSLPENTYVYCGGEYAKEQLLKYYPEYREKTDVLYYAAPDVLEEYRDDPVYDLKIEKGQRLIFAVVGQQDSRKGHDVFAKAIKLLPEEERKQAYFFFVGTHFDREIQEEVDDVCQQFPEDVFYIEQIEHRALFSFYKQCDCIVCSSKDDPLPVFVTEAMMLGKIIICSENTGSAPIIEKMQCGLIYKNNDPGELKKKIESVMKNHESMGEMCRLARSAYEEYFSEERFADRVRALLNKHSVKRDMEFSFDGTVSVIIPTYNAGTQFENLITVLKNQQKIRKLEIVIIDSGSTDGTVELCYKHGLKLFRIPQKDFTHSYARNLGAKKAVGDILLFMTQDALPIGNKWIYKMIQPIMMGEAAATSCREKNPEDTELYYKIASAGFAKFLKTDQQDQLNTLNGDEDTAELRRKASLSDVSCAIQADVFRQLYYRYNYAEDLDMGIRLLNRGYRIRLFSDVRVLHGHNRSCGYYARRAFVEQLSMEKIMEGKGIEKENLRVAALRVVSLCEAVSKTIPVMRENQNCTVDLYLKPFIDHMWYFVNNPGSFESGLNCRFSDEILNACVDLCVQYSFGEAYADVSLLHSIRNYVEHEMRPYLDKHNIVLIDENLSDQIIDCILKQTAVFVGSELAKIYFNSELEKQFEFLKNGI